MYRINQKSLLTLLVLSLVTIGLSVPVQQSETLAPSYGDSPPALNARDYWGSQNDEVQVPNEEEAKEGIVEDDNVDDNISSNEVVPDQKAQTVDDDSEQDDTTEDDKEGKSHVIVKRNKRPIRYRSKSFKA